MVEKQGETAEKDEHGCVAGKETWSEEQQKCVAKPPPAEEKAFMDKIMAVFNEAIDKRMNDFWKQVEKKMEDAVNKVQDQAVQSLRKGLGVSEDPVVHLSELPELMRKTILELQPPGKRTETETLEKPAGDVEKAKVPKAEDRFKELMKNRGLTA